MIVLVTGSTGFIGSHLCRHLIAQGYTVRAFHRASSTLRMLEQSGVEWIEGDLTQSETVENAMQGVDILFHTAALVGGRDQPGRMYAVTVEGTRAVMRAALRAGVQKVIHTSSVAALGVPERAPYKSENHPLLTESHTWNFQPEHWPYGYTKYLAELEVQWAVARGLDAVIVNPSHVFGPGDIYRQTSSLIVQVARGVMPGTMEGGVNAVHVDDVIAGHLAALEYGIAGERYILGGYNITITDLVQKIASIAGVTPPRLYVPGSIARRFARPLGWIQPYISLPQRANLLYLAGYYLYYDIRKAQSELRLPTPLPLEDSINDAYDWFAAVGAC